MPPAKSVSLYRRLPSVKYEYCVPQGIYIRGTKFILRLYEAGHRSWHPLPEGIDYVSAMRMVAEKVLVLSGPPIAENHHPPAIAAPLPGRTVLRVVVDSYIDKLYADNNLRPKTIQGKQFELRRRVEFCQKKYAEFVTREDLISYRDHMRKEGYAAWTINSNLMSIVTCLKKSP